MKSLNFGTKIMWRVFGAVAALAMLVGFVFAPAATAYADDGTAAAPGGGKRLEAAFKAEQKWLAAQAERLSKANEFSAEAQKKIDELKAKGKDTSALETALANYQAQIAAAQAAHDNAVSILGAHAGFDENGKVTDRSLAKNTVQAAHTALAEAHRSLRQARIDLMKALKDWRNANKTK